jgi:glycosyltransferase involved in cell wall biosynthesis
LEQALKTVNLARQRPLVSIIIPVYNDADRLKQCLQKLSNQTYAPCEVIVVDNGSACLDEVSAVVKSCAIATLICESTAGSYAARNRGIASAQGEILAFTDADCLPAPDWIEQGVAQLQSNIHCGLVAGAIQIVTRNLEHPVELYESVMGLSQQKFVEQDHFGATANLFTWPHVFERVGQFNPALKSNGDRDWGQRVFAAGYSQIYASSAIVEHPARHSFAQLSRQASRHAGGFYDLHCRQKQGAWAQNLAYFKLLGFHLMPPVMFALSMAHHPQLKTLTQKAKVVFTLSYVRLIIVKSLLQLKLGGVSERE